MMIVTTCPRYYHYRNVQSLSSWLSVYSQLPTLYQLCTQLYTTFSLLLCLPRINGQSQRYTHAFLILPARGISHNDPNSTGAIEILYILQYSPTLLHCTESTLLFMFLTNICLHINIYILEYMHIHIHLCGSDEIKSIYPGKQCRCDLC